MTQLNPDSGNDNAKIATLAAELFGIRGVTTTLSGCSVPLTGPTSTVDLYKQLLWPFYNKDGGTTGCACYGSPNLVGNSDKARVINYLFSRISR